MRMGLIAGFMLVSSAALAGETLVMPPYPAPAPWKQITDQHNDKLVWNEWIPSDQTEADIHDILTEQIFYTLKGRDPGEFVRTLFQQIRGVCVGARVNGPTPQTENGFAVAYAQIYCVGQKGVDKDVDIFVKAISGHDALYVVQREFRRPAEPGAQAGLRKFGKDDGAQAQAALQAQKVADDFLMSQIKLCAGGDTAICPSGPVAATAAAATPLPVDPDDVSASFGFVPGKSTAGDVEAKFGPSSLPTHAGDGRHTDTYTFRNGIIVVFLFGKDDVLIRTIAYSHQ
jgi:hypothetical protein